MEKQQRQIWFQLNYTNTITLLFAQMSTDAKRWLWFRSSFSGGLIFVKQARCSTDLKRAALALPIYLPVIPVFHN